MEMQASSDASPGDAILIHSLNARADLNGFVGHVEAGVDEGNGRLAVRLPPSVSGAAVLLKPTNMTRLGDVVAAIADHVDGEHADEIRERVRSLVQGGTKVLDLEETGLGTLPAEVSALGTDMQELWLASNTDLQVLPAAIASLQSLRLLDVDNCRLAALPDALGHLPALRSLYANANGLKALPASLAKLRSLRELRLSDNCLGHADESAAGDGSSAGGGLSVLGALVSLSALWLARNALSALPVTMCALVKLKELDLEGNRLQALPAALLDMGRLEELAVEGNPLEWPPMELARDGLATMRHWRAMLREPQQASEGEQTVAYAHEPEGSVHTPAGLRDLNITDQGGEFIFPGQGR